MYPGMLNMTSHELPLQKPRTVGNIMTLVWIMLVFVCMVCHASADDPRPSMDLSGKIPDFCQTDPAGKFPDKGGDFCAPVSVSNSFLYLSKSGYPKLRPAAATDKDAQIKLIHRLASKDFMDTIEKDGTSPPRLMAGVQRSVGDAGYEIVRLEQQGWKESTKTFPRTAEVPSLEWMKTGLSAPRGAVWLNVGWYAANAETKEFQRKGGHWVTLVGYGKDRSGKDDPLTLQIHDPAPRTGMKPLTQWIKLSSLDQGTLQRTTGNDEVRRREAKGFYTMQGEMKLKTGADTAILDAAVILQLK